MAEASRKKDGYLIMIADGGEYIFSIKKLNILNKASSSSFAGETIFDLFRFK